MESLINALQRITLWYQDSEQGEPETFPKGLSFEDLTRLLGYLPFKLPEEVCVLYQRCNNYQYDINYIPKPSIIPLKEAMDLWFEENDEEKVTPTWYQFPVFSHENGLFVIVGGDEMEDSSPVWDVNWLDDELREPVFPDIASMMTGIADGLEAERKYWGFGKT
jgi:hypothetical protein